MKKILLILAFAQFFTSSVSFAAEPPVYVRQTLRLPGELLHLAVADLDGDGLKDIVAVCLYTAKGKPPVRCFSVFYQRKGTGFPPIPDESWVLDPEASVFDVGDVQKDGKKAIVYMRHDGLYAYLPSNRVYNHRSVPLVKAQSVFDNADPLDLPRWPLVLKDDGRDTGFLMVPGVSRLLIRQAAPGYRPAGVVPLFVRTTFTEDVMDPARLTVMNKIPSIYAVPFNAPSSEDLFITWEDDADVFARRGEGFAEPPVVRFRPGLMELKKGLLDNAVVKPVDLMGNGTYDLVVTKMTGGLAQTKSLVFIYQRSPGARLPLKPTQTVVAEGVIGPQFLDMNGDGRLDMILPTVKMGINNIINMVTSKTVNMTIGIYLQEADGRFPERPDKEKQVSFKFNIANIGKNPKPVMAFGKFSKGPGYGLAVAAKEDRVALYMPDRYSFIADNAALDLKVPAPTELRAMDLNGDGIDDLVMSYEKNKAESDVINIFLSK